MQTQVTDKLGKWVGKVTLTNFKIVGEEATRIHDLLANAGEMAPDIFEGYMARLRELCGVKEQTFNNQIVSVGRQCFSARLINELTYTGVINYGAVGTGSTAIADNQTTLTTEVKRKGIATRSRTGNTVTLRFFYSKSDVSGTFNEFATFIDGTASADTGVMFNRVLTGGWVKSSLEALTVTVQFDLNAS